MTENKFDREELDLIIRETRSFNAQDKDCVGKCLSAKKKKGIKIDKQAMAICLKECGQSREQKSKSGQNWKPIPRRKGPVIRL